MQAVIKESVNRDRVYKYTKLNNSAKPTSKFTRKKTRNWYKYITAVDKAN